MNKQELGATTTSYMEISWSDDGFSEPEPNELWLRLPKLLKIICRDEVSEGNAIYSILENRERGIVVLSFDQGPCSKIPEDSNDLMVHRKHKKGNYCYDGTLLSLEEKQSGCILCFDDPDYDHSEYI